jgi:hypothetical protein
LRNIFDNICSQNRETHALMTAINDDRKMLGLLLRELIKVEAPGTAVQAFGVGTAIWAYLASRQRWPNSMVSIRRLCTSTKADHRDHG